MSLREVKNKKCLTLSGHIFDPRDCLYEMCLLNGRTGSSASKHREMSHGNSGMAPESRNINHEVVFGRGHLGQPKTTGLKN